MPRPDVPGMPVTEYEEIWRELASFPDDPNAETKGISYILDSEVVDACEPVLSGQMGKETVHVTRTFLGRSCGIYLALRQKQTYSRHRDSGGDRWVITDRTGQGEVSARREEWGSAGWNEKYVLGPDGSTLPSMKAGLDIEGKGAWKVGGQTVSIGGESYTVRSIESK